MNNPLLMTDSYKISHFKQYPAGTEHVYSYIEARKGDTPVVVFGINEFICKIWQELTEHNVSLLEELAEEHGVPFNTEGFDRLLEKHGVPGEFPLLIRGLPEGTVVQPGVPIATIVNTDPEFPWLTSFFETLFLRCVWYPSTVASISRAAKVVIKEGLEKSGDPELLPFKLHDFGARGVSSGESAAIGGAAHLINFSGTDTMEAIHYVRHNHNEPMAGFSIPATEHSTVTSWGREHERDMYEEFIRSNLGEGKIAACVSDSYNIYNACDMWKTLEPLILETGGTIVIRPDSGDPVTTPVQVIEYLMDIFGYTNNAKGYRVLPDHVRVIQGDGITLESLGQIIDLCTSDTHRISLDNLAFGMGGGLLQHCDRDTYGFAMKCSAAKVDGEWRDVYKDPLGGGKTSKRGLVDTKGGKPIVHCYYNADDVIFGLDTRTDFVTYYNGTSDFSRAADDWETIKGRAEV